LQNVEGASGFRRLPKKIGRRRIFRNRPRRAPFTGGRRPTVTKPPKSTPHSDLDGVHEDEKRNVDSANEAGQGSADLALARDRATGRPPYSDDVESRDERS
jgi:hypothetical protein